MRDIKHLVGKTIALAELNSWKMSLEFTDGTAIEVTRGHEVSGEELLRVKDTQAKTEYQRVTENLSGSDMTAMLKWLHTENLAPTVENIRRWKARSNLFRDEK